MNTPLNTLLDRLQGVRISGRGYQALCPAHPDKEPSLSITQSEDRILIHCHAGCETEAIVKAAGLEMPDLFVRPAPTVSGNARPRQVATYDYTDDNGTMLYQVVRYEPKGFKQRRPIGNGNWLWNLAEIERIPYRLPNVLRAVEAGETVFIVEGEKDVISVESTGLTATCNAGGSGQWRKSMSDHLQGANVVIIPDNDDPGRQHALDVAGKLLGIASSIKVVELPELPLKGDVTDWIAQGHTGDDLKRLAFSIKEWTPDPEQRERPAGVFSHYDLVTGSLEPIPWIVEGIIPEGSVCLLAGDSGVGKSWLSFHMAQAVSGSIPFLGHFKTTPCRVLYLDAESGENLLRRRFKKLWRGLLEDNPNLSPELSISVQLLSVKLDRDGCTALEERIRSDGITLVILDPMIHFTSGDENSSRETAEFLEGLREVAHNTGCTFFLVHHVRKESRMNSNSAGQMIRGSSAIRGVMDSILYARKLTEGKVMIEHDKCRHAEPVPTFLVGITDPDDETTCIRYSGESKTSETDRREIAEAVITRTLADNGGAASRQELVTQCKAESVSERTVNEVLKRLSEKAVITKKKQGKAVVYGMGDLTLPD
jgi:energy-coupling factor transporter ATP-binding protein EcfA2